MAKKLDTVTSYNEYVNENAKIDNQFYPGYFYTYYYDYKQDVTAFYKIPKPVRDFYDGRPLVFMFERYVTKDGRKMARGINLHYMPVMARQIWLQNLARVASEYIKNEARIQVPKELILQLTLKTKFAIKQYDINKISKVRKVPFSNIGPLANFTPPTHEGKSYYEIATEYRLFQPGQKRSKG
jgi:hypothetical protein